LPLLSPLEATTSKSSPSINGEQKHERKDEQTMTNTPVTGRAIHIYLPVEGPGALFSMVDGHAAQGDGEVCGTAIETPMRATVRLTVRKDLQVPEPQFLTSRGVSSR
jgi:acetamidase/formamidase